CDGLCSHYSSIESRSTSNIRSGTDQPEYVIRFCTTGEDSSMTPGRTKCGSNLEDPDRCRAVGPGVESKVPCRERQRGREVIDPGVKGLSAKICIWGIGDVICSTGGIAHRCDQIGLSLLCDNRICRIYRSSHGSVV